MAPFLQLSMLITNYVDQQLSDKATELVGASKMLEGGMSDESYQKLCTN